MQDAVDALENFYHGEWNNEREFATEFFHEMHDVSDDVLFYIDYEAFSRDLFINDFFSLQVDGVVHVFAIIDASFKARTRFLAFFGICKA